jgi:hypothetical protein
MASDPATPVILLKRERVFVTSKAPVWGWWPTHGDRIADIATLV